MNKKIILAILPALLMTTAVFAEGTCPEGYMQAESPLETVAVPSTSSVGQASVNSLNLGEPYVLEASGTWNNQGGANKLDAEYSTIDNWATPDNGYDHSPYFLGEGFGDLQVDVSFVDWGTYNSAHEYSIGYTGTGSAVNFRIFDGDSNIPTLHPEWYGDNSGSLQVDIYNCVCDMSTYYQDSDGDGYGNPLVTIQECSTPEGYVTDNTDCDDTNLAVHPDATEVCNGIDDNCNGLVDEIDADHDGVNDCNGDLCLGTVADTMTLGTNRWMWISGPSFSTVPPKGKGWDKGYTLEQTHGCSCAQILASLPGNMEGHWKFGCSIGIMNNFIK